MHIHTFGTTGLHVYTGLHVFVVQLQRNGAHSTTVYFEQWLSNIYIRQEVNDACKILNPDWLVGLQIRRILKLHVHCYCKHSVLCIVS